VSDDSPHTAPTLFLLMAQYNGQTVVPLDRVCRDFFGHLTVDKLLRKALRGDIALPIVRIETSQKAQRGVHRLDLAAYIDKRRAVAQGAKLIEHPTTSAPLRNGHPPRDVRRDSEAKRADSAAAIQMLQAVGDVSIVSDLTESQHFADQFLAMHRRCNRKTMAVRKSRPYRHFLRSSLTVCVAFRADDAVSIRA
jgi:hypothetical protein